MFEVDLGESQLTKEERAKELGLKNSLIAANQSLLTKLQEKQAKTDDDNVDVLELMDVCENVYEVYVMNNILEEQGVPEVVIRVAIMKAMMDKPNIQDEMKSLIALLDE